MVDERADAQPIEVAGRALRCRHCGHGAFGRREALWDADTSATAYVCARCGHVHWFLLAPGDGQIEAAPPQAQEEAEVAPPEAGACLACGAPMAAGATRCSSCGLHYVETVPAAVEVGTPLERVDDEPPEVDDEVDDEIEEPVEADVPADAPGTCGRCGARRMTRTSICPACGSIYEE